MILLLISIIDALSRRIRTLRTCTCDPARKYTKASFSPTARRLQTPASLNGGQPPQHSQATSQSASGPPPTQPPQVSHQLPPLASTVSTSAAALQARHQTLRLQRLQVEHERLRLRQQEIIKTVCVIIRCLLFFGTKAFVVKDSHYSVVHREDILSVSPCFALGF